MSDLTAYEERQEDEVEFLQAVFFNPGDFQDLRKNDTWKVVKCICYLAMRRDINYVHQPESLASYARKYS